ncbi:Gfo/Idh/MocA family oxidoreductase [candidate division KSB1 bacterium]|nr:Gfo/Idh/MocA family oxidoreductase [candidate division KSB1 bacterium]
MTKLRTGLIGCGRVAHLHAASLQKLDSSLFTAVCSRNRQRSTNFGKQYSVSAFTDVEEMIDRSKLDMVIICTPHPFHAFPAVTAANAGVHVLVEKPLASSLKDCDAMIYAADKAGVLLGTMSQRRWYAPVQRVKKALLDGKLGMPILGTVTMYGWRDKKYYDSDDWRGTWNAEGGGVLVNQAPHQLDLLQWYMGPIDQLFGYWDNLNHPYIEVEDTAIAVLRFKNGALGNIVVSNSQNPALFGKVTVFGGNGACASVQTDGGAMFIAGMSSIAEPPYNDLWTIAGEEKMLEIWKQQDADFFNGVNPMEYYHQQQISDFLEAILQNREPEVTGREGRKTVEIFTAVYRSQRDKRPVQFPLLPESDR